MTKIPYYHDFCTGKINALFSEIWEFCVKNDKEKDFMIIIMTFGAYNMRSCIMSWKKMSGKSWKECASEILDVQQQYIKFYEEIDNAMD